MKKIRKLWLLSTFFISMLFLAACGSDKYEKKLVGSWYQEGSPEPAFILYGDGTCEIAGEYGEGAWRVDDKQLVLVNYYGESERAPIVSIKNGCLMVGDKDDPSIFYSEPTEDSELSDGMDDASGYDNLMALDPFEDIVIECSGWTGSGKVERINVDNCVPEVMEYFTFELVEDYSDLSNGDDIQVRAVYDEKILEENGWYMSSDDIREFYVEDLNMIVGSNGYYDDVAWVYTKDMIARLCDKNGNILFSLDEGSKPTTEFYNGVALVDENKLIDKTGKTIWSADIEGRAYAEQRWGEGAVEEIKILQYEFGKAFIYIFVNSYEHSEHYIGILDNTGKWVLEPEEEYSSIRNLNHINKGDNGITELTRDFGSDREFIYYNAITDEKIEGWNDDVFERWEREYYCSQHNGLIYEKKDGAACFCDAYGNIVLDLSGYDIRETSGTLEFNDGYTLLDVANDGGYQFYTVIDTKGNEMFPPRSNENGHSGLKEGFYYIENQYYDVNGEPVFDLALAGCKDFQDGMALVDLEEDRELHFINTNGEIVY